MRIWIDIDNPPQARYLLPFVHRFEAAGHDVLLTARAYGDTLAILRSEGATFEAIGTGFGKGMPRKVYGLIHRASELVAYLNREPVRVDLVLTGSRSATLAARKLKIPSFVIIDYEYVHLLLFRFTNSHILHPNIIEPATFRRRGIKSSDLLAFRGLKEDVSFADLDPETVPPHDFGSRDDAVRVLFRPPAEESHYYRSESRVLALELLRYLASEGAIVVFSPRLEQQVEYLDDVAIWKKEPIIMREPVPFVSLLKAVDAVVSAGGTMLREAAYLGVPAYSIFRSRIGGVDRYLTSINRLTLLSSPADFSRIRLTRNSSISPLRHDSRVVEDVIALILDRVGGSAPHPGAPRSTSVV